jgi:two-component system, chemotaxis family, protein-glutamate methylesterase/glutaminase
MIRLLIVDDSALMRKLLADLFRATGAFEVAVARNGAEAIEQLHAFQPHVITLDVHMPDMDGLACLDRIMLERPCPVVMVSSLTAEGAEETLEAIELGAVDFIAKPRGPVSLELDAIAAPLVAKVRAAAEARIPRTRRLADRIRLARPALPRRRRAGRLADIQAVLVGVSTGGPAALDALLEPLPAAFPWPIVIAQHMPASFTGALARRLDRQCALGVSEVARPTVLEGSQVYIGRGDADLLITRRAGRAAVTPAPASPAHLWHPSVDRLVRSGCEVLGAAALVGVMMTGMGADGAEAMADLRRGGGHVIAQDAETSVVWGMPGALVALDGADQVLPLDDIAARLADWARP